MYYRRYRKDSFRTYVDFISSLPAWQIEGGGNKKGRSLGASFRRVVYGFTSRHFCHCSSPLSSVVILSMYLFI